MFQQSHLDARYLGDAVPTASDGSTIPTPAAGQTMIPAVNPAIPSLPQVAVIALVALGVFLLLKHAYTSSDDQKDEDHGS